MTSSSPDGCLTHEVSVFFLVSFPLRKHRWLDLRCFWLCFVFVTVTLVVV